MTACTENVAQDNPFEMGWVRFGLKGPRGQVPPTDTMKKQAERRSTIYSIKNMVASQLLLLLDE